MKEALFFWAAAQGAALAFVPVTFLLFPRLPDRGYSLAKPLGLLTLAYVGWIAGVVGLVPNGRGLFLMALVLLAAVGVAVAVARWEQWRAWWRMWWPYVLWIESLFLVTYLAAVFLHSFVPEIIWGEKPFELAFLNSVVRSSSFPPPDPWLSGYSINYYYFGYVQAGALTHLTGLPTSITFGLMLCMVAAMAACAAFGLAYNLTLLLGRGEGQWRALGAGGISVVLLLVVSNLAGLFELLARHGIGNSAFYAWVGIYGLEPYNCTLNPSACRAWYPTAFWWWWKATRMGSPWDVQEFPFFSFQFGDLHPHVLALPLTLVALGLALDLYLEAREGRVLLRWRREPWQPVVGAMVLGGLGFTDLWALPTFGVLVVGAMALGAIQGRREGGFWDALGAASALALGALLLYAPFYVTLQTPASGIAPNQAWERLVRGYPPIDSVVTRPVHFLIFWLPSLWLPLWWTATIALGRRWGRLEVGFGVAAWAVPLMAWAASVLALSGLGHVSPRPEGFLGEVKLRWENLNWLTMLMLVAFLTMAGAGLARTLRGRDDERAIPMALALVALLLLLGGETFFIRDPVGFRYNTVFRFWYHTWTIMAVVGGVGAAALWQKASSAWLSPPLRWAWQGVTLAIMGAAFIYPLTVTLERTEAFRRSGGGLDGLAFVARHAPDEYAAVIWFRQHVRGSPVVLEAFGEDYTDFARISSRTGLVTVLGWEGHEWQWRPDPAPIVGRARDIETIYTTLDVEEALRLLHKYDVRYVVVGPLERQRYVEEAPLPLWPQREQALAKFDGFLEVAFRTNRLTIYKVPHGPGLIYP